MANGDQTFIASRLPGGLIFSIDEPQKEWEPTPAGSREVTVWRPTGEYIRIKGTNQARREQARDTPDVFHDGWAISTVLAESWAKLLDQKNRPGKQLSLFESRVVIWANKLGELKAKIKDHAEIRTGLEPLGVFQGATRVDVSADPRTASLRTRGMTIATADEMPPHPGWR
jgi:hypothetical protein